MKDDRGELDLSKQIEDKDELIYELRQRINELLAIGKSHQQLMGEQIQQNEELKRDNKLLAKQVNDYFSNDVTKNPGFWSWLSLYYFDSVCPSVKGKRKPYASYRHLFDSEDRTGKYRHLLASPYVIYKQLYPAYRRGMAVLQGPVHPPGEVVEQIGGIRQLSKVVPLLTQFDSPERRGLLFFSSFL